MRLRGTIAGGETTKTREGSHLFSRFMRREYGTITTFALLIFVLMVAVGGIAVDIMRYETQRAQLQYTLDRSVLAAASVTQPLNPVDVVENYFEISGLENYRLNVDVEEGVNWRRVNAYAELEVNTFFMHMFGVRVLTSPAEGAAEERIRNVEISMVLDVSGSMGSYSRIQNMRNAAREFVTTVLDANESDQGNLVSISIVPYNGMVNAGSTIASVFNLSDEHSASNCTRFSSDQFSRTSLTPTEEIERLAHWDHDDYYQYDDFDSGYCPTDDDRSIIAWQHDEGALHSYIDSLYAEGWTAIDLGMNWGVALLDPAARPALNSLVTSGTVHGDFENRPADFDDEETIKVVVLMTDGENTRQYDVRQPFKRGSSPIYYHQDHDRYSVYVASRGEYWISYYDPDDYSGYWDDEPYRGNESSALSWPYLWANYTGHYIADRYLAVPAYFSGDDSLFDAIRYNGQELYAGRSEADANLRTICDAAKASDRRILVFAIGFEAPQGGQDVMRYCASSDAHYYDVEGIEITDAFASIARTINQLRLIQ
jgi:Flp pilus assembly protein TadG